MLASPVQSDTAVPVDIVTRVAAYRAGRDPFADLAAVYDVLEAEAERPEWISILPREQAVTLLTGAVARFEKGADLPLFGIPFAVKDNIDVAGLETTAGCPDFAFAPEKSAFVVEKLIEAGAIPVGKTNLDQFATGLNGTRSPYGIPVSAFDDTRVSGGSSSGSAIAVARGLVPFALGTDTAGSGRIPAGFNNIVGLKPTKGLLSTSGILPACRTLDCVSIFAASVDDAFQVLKACAVFDVADPYARVAPEALHEGITGRPLRFGIPGKDVLAQCAPDVAARYRAMVSVLEADGAVPVEIDFGPLEEAASMLYSGPWVAERLAAIQGFVETRADAMHPVVRDIILSGADYTAADAFAAQYKLAEIKRNTEALWREIDYLLVPTAPEHPTVEAMLASPVALNSRLGLFTNFVNLLDMAALSVPAGWTGEGLPVGVTLIGPACSDASLALIGDRLHRSDPDATLGSSSIPLAAARPVEVPDDVSRVAVAVVGAHLKGQPLNHQLTGRGARLVATARTAPGYSLYVLPDTVPAKSGLVRDGGAGLIEIEVWDMPLEGFGALVAEIPGPLGIGSIETEDGAWVKGFVCESHAIANADDITGFGGWRNYLTSKSPPTLNR